MSPEEAERVIEATRWRPEKMPRSFVERQRRLRAARAAAEIAHQSGIGTVTVAGICMVAKMARNSFYEVFENVGECLRFGFAEAFGQTFSGIREASQGDAPWPQRLNSGLENFYATVAREPLAAELCLVHCFGAAEMATGSDFDTGVASTRALLEGGRVMAVAEQVPSPAPPMTEECLARMIVSLAAQMLTQGRALDLPGQQPAMEMLALTSLLGIEEASRRGTA